MCAAYVHTCVDGSSGVQQHATRLQVRTLSADLQSLRAQLAEARSVEVGLRSREELSRREVALANEAVEEHVRTNETLQVQLPGAQCHV